MREITKRGGKFRLGHHWMTDDRTGIAHWDDEVVRQWDGLIVKKGSEETRHPQEYIRQIPNDGLAPNLIVPEQGINFDTECGYHAMEFVPRTVIKRRLSNTDLLQSLPGIGAMTIGPPADECGYLFEIQGIDDVRVIEQGVFGSLFDPDDFGEGTVINSGGIGKSIMDGSLLEDADTLNHGLITVGIEGSLLTDTDTLFHGDLDLQLHGSLLENTNTFNNSLVCHSTDGDFSSVVLLTHLDAATPVDQGDTGHTLTVGSGATRDTSIKLYGASSFDFDGSTTAHIQAADHADWSVGSGDFTMEIWSYFDTLPLTRTNDLITHYSASGSQRGFEFSVLVTPVVRFTYTTSGSTRVNLNSDSVTLIQDTWHHIAVSRVGNNLYQFFDGVLIGTHDVTGVSIHNSTAALRIGSRVNSPDFAHTGKLEEVRFTKGVGRYNETFTPPACPHPDS